ncbi:MAG: type VI secretion system baseplate subunit TssG [Planctomycetaceae bacterium]|nr:type VI secretion system baseplate subunit TssG [Planctomycetaceae bacterium]
MAATDWATPDTLTKLSQRPQDFELFQALRLIDAASPDLPQLGEAAGPHDESVRIGIDPSLVFAACDLSTDATSEEDSAGSSRTPRLHSRGFGLLGPHGPLPLSVTESIRASLLHEKDAAPLHFVEMLQHRMVMLFYRAYMQSRAAIQADRPDSDRFSLYLGALFGRHPALADRDDFADSSRLYFTGRYAAGTRSAEALEAIIAHEFNVQVDITPFALGWLNLNPRVQTALGRPGEAAALGVATIVGERVQDRQSHIQLRLGPLPLYRFQQLLPSGEQFASLAAMVREFTRGELFCKVQLVLLRDEVPPTILGQQGCLGRVSWLGSPPSGQDAADAEFSLC